MQGTIKDLRLIQCFAWFLLIFWVVVATTLDEKIKGEERRKREIQENITKTRLTQKIDNSNPYQSIQPILPGQQAYPVQFEPLAHIRLSRSTYKVTTFIEFKPYIKPDTPINVYTQFCLNTAKSKFSLVSPVADW